MALTIKAVPRPSLDNLIPPNKNYEYFAAAELCPFESKACEFSLVNAWWMAEVSLLAYADEDFSQERYGKLGLTFEFIQGPITGTECFVVSSDQFIWVVFRGTQIKPVGEDGSKAILKDILTDVKIKFVKSANGGEVHTGFAQALDEVWGKCVEAIARLKAENPARTLWFTGHSLGAALATLASQRCTNVQGLYIFGAPSVGNAVFAEQFNIKTFRVINNNDLVARVPPYPYVHIGEIKYIDSYGTLHEKPKNWDMFTDRIKGHMDTLVNYFGTISKAWNSEIPSDYFNDHAPIYYAVHLWNSYVKSRAHAADNV